MGEEEEEGEKQRVKERERGKKGGGGDRKSKEQCFEVARFVADSPLNLYTYTPFSCALHGFVFILVIEKERERERKTTISHNRMKMSTGAR